MEIYTDGSWDMKTKHGGWAVVINPDKPDMLSLAGSSPSTTNVKMELTALYKALKYIESENITERVNIYTDSKTVITNLLNPEKEYHSEHPITKMRRILDYYDIKLTHVFSHINIRGNELADKLAKEQMRQLRYEDKINRHDLKFLINS